MRNSLAAVFRPVLWIRKAPSISVHVQSSRTPPPMSPAGSLGHRVSACEDRPGSADETRPPLMATPLNTIGGDDSASAIRLSAPVVVDPVRLAALDGLAILDTSPEQGFDDIVRLATRLCAVPVALVSLVTAKRQWFKARLVSPTARPISTPRSASTCSQSPTSWSSRT